MGDLVSRRRSHFIREARPRPTAENATTRMAPEEVTLLKELDAHDPKLFGRAGT